MPDTASVDVDMKEIKAVFDVLGLNAAVARAPFIDAQRQQGRQADLRVVVSSSSDPFAR